MDGLQERVSTALADYHDDGLNVAGYSGAATAVLEEIKPAVISMFRVMAQPGIPALTPEQRWDAMMEDRSEEMT